jgi:hypothetical protein
MLSLKNYDPYEPFTYSDPVIEQMVRKSFPHLYPESKTSFNPLNKVFYFAGKSLGTVKNFFSKTETKVATLVAYWAADAFIALILLLTTTNTVAATVAVALLILHTYATFSIVNEVI